MNKIAKKTTWLAQHGKLVGGVLYLTLYLIAVALGEWKNIVIFGMFIFGLGDIYGYFKNKKRNWNQEYVAWDEEKIVLQRFRQELLTYTWDEVDEINLTEENLTIKSGAANGIMYELKGYDTEDIQQLQSLVVKRPAA